MSISRAPLNPLESEVPAERASRVRAMFGAITPRYDLLNAVLSMGLDRGWRREAVRLGAPGIGGRAADICTGTGDLARLLADHVGPGGEVAGVDFCEEMLVRAREKFPPSTFPQLRFVQGDALELPLPDRHFDAVTMAFGLRNLVDPPRGFREMARILRPGGRALVLELTRPSGLLKLVYFPYLFAWLPLVGGLISKNRTAYQYLARSIAAFLSVEQVCARMAEAGFEHVEARPLCGGIATLFYGVAPGGTSRG